MAAYPRRGLTFAGLRPIRYEHDTSPAHEHQTRTQILLTTVWIIRYIVGLVNSASIDVTLGRNIRNARGNLCPQRLAGSVTGKQSGGLPYCWKAGTVLGRGWIRIRGAFLGWVCEPAAKKSV